MVCSSSLEVEAQFPQMMNPSMKRMRPRQDLFSKIVMQNDIEELVNNILIFLTPRSLVTMSCVSREWRSLATQEELWLRLCQRLWRLRPLNKPKVFGATTWRRVFQVQYQRQRLPRGVYSNKHNIVWAKGRQNGVNAWVTLAHRSDCRTIVFSEATDHGLRQVAMIYLRIVIQNLSESTISLVPSKISVVTKDGSLYSTFSNDMFGSRASPRLLALNGELLESNPQFQNLKEHRLQPLEFGVYGIHLRVPGCSFETDFLERASCIVIPFYTPGSKGYHAHYFPESSRYLILNARFVDESVVWSYYTVFANGFVVLKDKEPLRES